MVAFKSFSEYPLGGGGGGAELHFYPKTFYGFILNRMRVVSHKIQDNCIWKCVNKICKKK